MEPNLHMMLDASSPLSWDSPAGIGYSIWDETYFVDNHFHDPKNLCWKPAQLLVFVRP